MGFSGGPDLADRHGRAFYVEESSGSIVLSVNDKTALFMDYETAEKLSESLRLHLHVAGFELDLPYG